jgi:hypothetical protein
MCVHERVSTNLFCATPWLWFLGQLLSLRTSQYYTQKQYILALCTYLRWHFVMTRVWLSIHVACGGFVSLSMVNPQPVERSPLFWFNCPQNLLPIEICTYHHRPGEAPLGLFPSKGTQERAGTTAAQLLPGSNSLRFANFGINNMFPKSADAWVALGPILVHLWNRFVPTSGMIWLRFGQSGFLIRSAHAE